MTTLSDVMAREVGEARFRASEAFAHGDQEVTAVKLSNGAPCKGHAGLFAPWPGPETGVSRWFTLSNGHAVGIEELSETEVRILLWEARADPI